MHASSAMMQQAQETGPVKWRVARIEGGIETAYCIVRGIRDVALTFGHSVYGDACKVYAVDEPVRKMPSAVSQSMAREARKAAQRKPIGLPHR